VRAGWTLARSGSDWYDFVTQELTLDRRDFHALTFATDIGVWLSPRAMLVVGAEVTHADAPSEYRALVDNNRQPISQSTRLVGFATTAGVKYALTARGRAIGQLAWIPAHVVPYVGAGGGAVFYHLRQTGDFVDFADSAVFAGRFGSSGWAPAVYAGGGADVRVGRRLNVTGDIRYRRAAARLNNTWVDFDPIDLSAVKVTVGTTWQF
jgi:opacity protein-like surface antigen